AREVLASRAIEDPLDKLGPVASGADVAALQARVREVKVEESILDYIIDLVTATRETDRLHVGVSPRGSLALRRAVQALALVSGRSYALPDDVKRLAVPVLGHRVIPKGRHLAGTQEGAEAIAEVVNAVAVPA
ncbi:MAG TPA: MoxR family ATPase, partial [Planctomycetota bacterium]|nr:MoxR family ATPase [Planctomycetota bacterium]